MNLNNKKKITKNFFNTVADEWVSRTYDPHNTYEKFPSNKARMEVALQEISRLKLKGKMLDIGCGSGHTVINLLHKHNDVRGMDASEGMIAVAKKNLKKSKIKKNPDEIFQTMDIDDISLNQKYKVVTALGFLEYLNHDKELFSVLQKIIQKNGYAFVGSRNKLFNLFSQNDHTAAIKSELTKLLKEFADVEKYSPVPINKVPQVQAEVSKKVSTFLAKASRDKKWLTQKRTTYSKFPHKLKLRSHTPQELESSAKRFGFILEYIVYYHTHPYPPAYEKRFPKIYNKIASLMSPLGHTPLGAWMCSGSVAVLRKK